MGSGGCCLFGEETSCNSCFGGEGGGHGGVGQAERTRGVDAQ